MTSSQIEYVIPRFPEDDEELWYFVQALWGFRVPRTQVCPIHVSPFQAFADAYFARHPVSVWKASRGFGGKTVMLATLTLTEAVCLGAGVSILGGSGAQSLNVHAVSQEAWHSPHAPRTLLTRDPTKYDTDLANGGYIRSLMASQTSVRGLHPQRLRLDEIDEMELAILEAAQGQPMRKKGIETQTVMSSTHQHPDGTMTTILERARENDWPIYEWCYKETANTSDGWLSPGEVARQRSVIPQHMWETEYDLQEPSFEGRAIDSASVDRCFDPVLGYIDARTNHITIEEPERRHAYVTGIDWAKERDQTIVATFRASSLPWTCVSWQRMNRLPWPVMVKKAMDQWQHYGGTLVHDATGLGNVVDDLLMQEMSRSEARDVKPVVMGAGRARQDMFSEYISAIEHDDMRYPRIDYAHAEHKYVTLDDLYGRGHPPDSFVAGSLAWSARKKYMRPKLTIAPQGVRADSPWI